VNFDITGGGTRRVVSDQSLHAAANAEERIEDPVESAVASSVAPGVLGFIHMHLQLFRQEELAGDDVGSSEIKEIAEETNRIRAMPLAV
jgi:hypothetical protein